MCNHLFVLHWKRVKRFLLIKRKKYIIMSRKITTLLLSSLLGLALIPATGVSANVGNDDSSSTGGGYVELSTTDTTAPTPVISLNSNDTLAVSKAAVKGKGLAPYKWHHIDGGDWLFGVYGTKVQSTYKHAKRNHTATAHNGNGVGPRVKARAGNTAFSQVNATLTGNKAFYGFY